MSVVSNEPTSAKIMALEKIQILAIPAELVKARCTSINNIDCLLFRIFSQVIVDKLWLISRKAKKYEETFSQLAKAKNYTDNLFRSMCDSLIVIDQKGVIMTVNSSLLLLLGYQENELLGREFGTLLASEYGAAFTGAELESLIHAGSIANTEVMLVNTDGRYIPVLISGSVMRDTNAKISGIIIVAKDITEYKETQEVIQKMQVKMLATSKLALIGEVATGVAHEINQPLTFISFCLQRLDMELQRGSISLDTAKSKYKSIGEIEQVVNTSNEQIQRIDDIIRHLQTFGRNDEMIDGSTSIENIELQTVVENTLLFLEERIRLRNIKLIKNFTSVPPVHGKMTKLEQIFVNLFQNAIHALQDQKNGIITVTIDYLKAENSKSHSVVR